MQDANHAEPCSHSLVRTAGNQNRDVKHSMSCGNRYLGNSAAVVRHVEEQHNVHVKLNAASTHVAYCQDCHKYIGKNTPGQESRKALEKHLHKKHEVDILE